MHLTSTELFAITNIALGAAITFTVGYLKDRASGKKTAAGQLHKDVNELIAAAGELQVTLAGLREQHESPSGRYLRFLLLFFEVVSHGGLKPITDRSMSNEGLHAAWRAGAAGGTSLMRWDREAVFAANSAMVAPLARVTLAAATLRSSGDEQFQKTYHAMTDAVFALPQAYGQSNRKWKAANDCLTDAVDALVKDAKRITVGRRWMGLRKSKELRR